MDDATCAELALPGTTSLRLNAEKDDTMATKPSLSLQPLVTSAIKRTLSGTTLKRERNAGSRQNIGRIN